MMRRNQPRATAAIAGLVLVAWIGIGSLSVAGGQEPTGTADSPFDGPIDLQQGEHGPWHGRGVIPRRAHSKIVMWEWVYGKKETWTPRNLMNAVVRFDRGGALRVHDTQREGWVSQEDMTLVEDALPALDRFAKANPRDVRARWNRGCALFRLGRFQDALDDFQWVARLEPNEPAYLNDCGAAAQALGLLDQAAVDFTEALRLDPRNVPALVGRGATRLRQRQFEMAILDFDQTLRLDPRNIVALRDRGDAYLSRNDPERAIADYNAALGIDPSYAVARLNRGVAWLRKNDRERAMADFDEALRINPTYVLARRQRGHAWHERGEYERAVADYTEAIRLEPNDAATYSWRANSRAQAKDFVGAKEDYEAAIKIQRIPAHLNSYAWFLATFPDDNARDGAKAIELAKEAVDNSNPPGNWSYIDTLAAAYAEAGDFNRAVQEQRRASGFARTFARGFDPVTLDEVEKRVSLFEQKQPWRETRVAPNPN